MSNCQFGRGGVAALLLLLCAAPALAQGRRTPTDTTKKDTTAVRMTPIVVTATRAERSVFETPKQQWEMFSERVPRSGSRTWGWRSQ